MQLIYWSLERIVFLHDLETETKCRLSETAVVEGTQLEVECNVTFEKQVPHAIHCSPQLTPPRVETSDASGSSNLTVYRQRVLVTKEFDGMRFTCVVSVNSSSMYSGDTPASCPKNVSTNITTWNSPVITVVRGIVKIVLLLAVNCLKKRNEFDWPKLVVRTI